MPTAAKPQTAEPHTPPKMVWRDIPKIDWRETETEEQFYARCRHIFAQEPRRG